MLLIVIFTGKVKRNFRPSIISLKFRNYSDSFFQRINSPICGMRLSDVPCMPWDPLQYL